jgi:hypothetical protein
MDEATRKALVAELTASFGAAEDRTPADGQPAHVLLPKLQLLPPWKPSQARALVRFTSNWPEQRPEFFIDLGVADPDGVPPRNNGGNPAEQVLVLGETWRRFSFPFDWPPRGPKTATRAVQLWLNRFRLPA